MNQQTYRKSFVVGAVAIGVIAGVAVGFFTAHGWWNMGVTTPAPAVEMADMGTEASRRPRAGGEMGEMKGMSMKQMDMKKMAPAGESRWQECQAWPQRRPGLW